MTNRTMEFGGDSGSPQTSVRDVSKWYISRPGGALILLVPVDELPLEIDLPDLPRQLHHSQLDGLKWLGEASGPNRRQVAISNHRSRPSVESQSFGAQSDANNYSVGVAPQLNSIAAASTGQTHAPDQVPRPISFGLAGEQQKHGVSQQETCNSTAGQIVQHPNAGLSSSRRVKAGPEISSKKPSGKPNTQNPKNTGTPTRRPAPPSGTEPDNSKKIYCTFWIRKGECDYMQTGCLFKHEMPDLATLNKIGFRNTPKWYKDKQAAEARKNAALQACPPSQPQARPQVRPQAQPPAQTGAQPRAQQVQTKLPSSFTTHSSSHQTAKTANFTEKNPFGAIGSGRKSILKGPTDEEILAASVHLVHPMTRKAYGLSERPQTSEYASQNTSQQTGYSPSVVQQEIEEEESLIDYPSLLPKHSGNESTKSNLYSASIPSSSPRSASQESATLQEPFTSSSNPSNDLSIHDGQDTSVESIRTPLCPVNSQSSSDKSGHVGGDLTKQIHLKAQANVQMEQEDISVANHDKQEEVSRANHQDGIHNDESSSEGLAVNGAALKRSRPSKRSQEVTRAPQLEYETDLTDLTD